jgi:Ca2+-transporting ATPase
MLYLGTAVVAGRGVALVVAPGGATELGHIGQLVADAPEELAPLEKRLAELGRQLVYVVLGVAAVVTLAGWLRGDELWGMVEVGISLAVAAVPEGLPAVTTLTLALGVLRMARQRAIVRRLAAVETLGSVTVICTDKTGTLTENRMHVREYRLSDGETFLTRARSNGRPGPLLARALDAGVLCNEASFHADAAGASQCVGDPTEIALLEAAHACGVDVLGTRASSPKLAELPFDASTMRMITLHAGIGPTRLAVLKGAPAAVLDRCSDFAGAAGERCALDAAGRERFLALNHEMADRALRVLGLAEKRLDGDDDAGTLERGYTFLGFVGMADPPRKEVGGAIRSAREAGIRTVMLTGDQLNTARAIAHELAFGDGGEVRAVHTHELREVTEERLD